MGDGKWLKMDGINVEATSTPADLKYDAPPIRTKEWKNVVLPGN